MITVVWFSIMSLGLIYPLWRVNRVPCQGVVLLCKFALPLLLGIQLFSIFQYGNETAGVPVRITFFEDLVINYLHLPNPTIQWLSFFFCMVTVIFCFPKRAE